MTHSNREVEISLSQGQVFKVSSPSAQDTKGDYYVCANDPRGRNKVRLESIGVPTHHNVPLAFKVSVGGLEKGFVPGPLGSSCAEFRFGLRMRRLPISVSVAKMLQNIEPVSPIFGPRKVL